MEGAFALSGKGGVSRDEFRTILAEAASIVNNTPLGYIPDHPDDPVPLSPAVLLTLRDCPNPAPPELYGGEDALHYASKRYHRAQHLAEQFWRSWREEYLLTLTRRHKWKVKKRCITVGDVVLIRDDRLQRNHWPMGRVVSVDLGRDDLVRSVELKTANSGSRPLRRPITKLVLLVPHENHNCEYHPASDTEARSVTPI